MEVSERTSNSSMRNALGRVPNTERKEVRDKYPLPKVLGTITAQLDLTMKSEVSTATKAADKQLARVQTLLLYSLAPLTSLLETHHKGDTPDQKEVILAVRSGIHLIGTLLHLRRDRVVSDINKALLLIVGDDSNFKEATPLLFGTEFAKNSKEMVGQVKAMDPP